MPPNLTHWAFNKRTIPSGPELPRPRDTLCALGASWTCDTHSREFQSHPDRRASQLPRVSCTFPPPPPPPPSALRPLTRSSCAPAPSRKCRPRSSGPDSPWAASGSTSSCRRDTPAWSSSCSRTAAGSPGRNCGCTWAPPGLGRSRSKWDRTAPAPAWSPSVRKQPVVEREKPPWSSGRRRVSPAGRRHEGAAPWWVPVSEGLLLWGHRCGRSRQTEHRQDAACGHRLICAQFISNQGYRSTGAWRTGLLPFQ